MQRAEGPKAAEQQQALQRGGVLYITDPPPTLDFGIDCMYYETGSNFRGVSMVPKGLHFVYYSTGMGSRQGFFVYFEKDSVVVKSWDVRNEDISSEILLTAGSLQALIRSITYGQEDQYLGPYPLQQHSSWLNLSNFMTTTTLQRAGLDFHTPIYPGDAEDIPVELLSEQNKQAVTSYFPDQARVAQFCDIQLLEQNLRRTVTSSATLDTKAKALELTKMHLDSSALLENVVSQYFDSNWEELLAEMQLSFMLFMLIFSFPALQQWKTLVNLVCRSERVLVSQPNFTSCFIRLFYEQLQYSPDDFFETEISSDNFLKPALSNLFESLDTQPLLGSLDAMRRRLFTFVQKKFNLYVADDGVQLDGEVDLHMCEGTKFNLLNEDMPVVVMPEDAKLSCLREEGGVAAASKRVSFESDLGAQQHDLAGVRSKWGEIDAALGLSGMQSGSGDSNKEDDGCSPMDEDNNASPVSSSSEPAGSSSDRNSSDTGKGCLKTNLELQAGMFSWRYPMLFDEMTRNNSLSAAGAHCGQEDLTMTAMRVMDTPDSSSSCGASVASAEGSGIAAVAAGVDPLRSEAMRFVRDEIALWQ